MRKQLSVIMLAARSTIYRVILLMAVSGALEAALFVLKMNSQTGITLENTVARSRISLVCLAAFILLGVLLSLTGCEFGGSKVRYTLQRLSVKEITVTLLWSLYNTCCFVIFWLGQGLIALALCRLYARGAAEGAIGPQTVFLAFYRNSFLHNLLPLSEPLRWVRNFLLCAGMGVGAACFSHRMRHEQRGLAVFVMGFLVLLAFLTEMGIPAADVGFSLGVAVVAGAALYGVWEACEHEE